MVRRIIDWVRTSLNLWQEITDQRETLRKHDMRIRDLEESFKLLAAELRHDREMAKLEREKLVLQLENVLAKQLPPPQRTKKRR